VVDVAGRVGVDVEGEHRDAAQVAATAVDPSGGVDPLEVLLVGPVPLRNDHPVDVVPPNRLVEVEELIDGDDPVLERLEPVLHPDVVQRSHGEAGGGVDAQQVHVAVDEGAAGAVDRKSGVYGKSGGVGRG